MVRLYGGKCPRLFIRQSKTSSQKKKKPEEIEFHPQDVERCINKFYINILFLRADEIDRLIFQEILME